MCTMCSKYLMCCKFDVVATLSSLLLTLLTSHFVCQQKSQEKEEAKPDETKDERVVEGQIDANANECEFCIALLCFSVISFSVESILAIKGIMYSISRKVYLLSPVI